MTPDWRDPTRADRIVCQMVSPLDLDEVLGELELEDGGSVSQGYYTDTRASASLITLDWGSWVSGSWLRILHQVRGTDYSRELFTGFPTSAAPTLRGVGPSGTISTKVELKSALFGADADVWPPAFTVGAGATARQAIERVCALAGLAHRVDGTVAEYRFTATRTWDSCTPVISMLFDLCDACGARMDVDGHGVVTFSRYVEPSLRTPQFALDATAPDTLVIDGSVSLSSDDLSLPNRSAVAWKDGDSELIAWSDLPSSSDLSRAHRGWAKTEVHQLQDMPEPRTQAHAQALADAWLPSDSTATREWECETLWWEAQAGMVGTFDPGDGSGPRRVMLKNVDSTLSAKSMTHKLTLKEV